MTGVERLTEANLQRNRKAKSQNNRKSEKFSITMAIRLYVLANCQRKTFISIEGEKIKCGLSIASTLKKL